MNTVRGEGSNNVDKHRRGKGEWKRRKVNMFKIDHSDIVRSINEPSLSLLKEYQSEKLSA